METRLSSQKRRESSATVTSATHQSPCRQKTVHSTSRQLSGFLSNCSAVTGWLDRTSALTITQCKICAAVSGVKQACIANCTTHTTLCTLHYLKKCVRYTIYTTLRTLHNLQNTMCTTQCTQPYAHYTLHFAMYTIYTTHYTTLFKQHYVHYTLHCVKPQFIIITEWRTLLHCSLPTYVRGRNTKAL